MYHIGGIADLLIFMLMLKRIFGLRVEPRRGRICLVVMLLGFGLCHGLMVQGAVTGLYDGRVQFILYVVFLLAFSWGYALLSLNKNYKQMLTTSFFYISIVMLLFDLRVTLSVLPGYLCLALTAVLFCALTRPITHMLSNLYWSVSLVTPLLLVILKDLINVAVTLPRWAYILVPIGLILVSLASYFLFIRLATELELQMKLELENQTLTFQLRQMESAEVMMEETRKVRHEMRSNCFMLEALLEEKKYDELQDVLHNALGSPLLRGMEVSTGNRMVDMLLSTKVNEARQLGIPIVLHVVLPENLSIDQQMLCSLLTNLLDNAIEASRQVSSPDIDCSMRMVKGYLAIEVRNKVDGSVLEKNPRLLTSKRDRANHGLGIKIIRQIVHRCDGNIEFWEDMGRFVVTIMLPEHC